MIHHLRGSGQLEQDANLILTIHRPTEMPHERSPEYQEFRACYENCRDHGYKYLQLYVDKGRDVAPGSVLHFAFDGEHGQLFDAHSDFDRKEQRFA